MIVADFYAYYYLDKTKLYLFKMHGCVEKNEQLILTRSDYRRHYRTNEAFFRAIEEDFFGERHILFLGFSHKDPEISRLVENAIYLWEKDKRNNSQPNFYSLQFDMTNYTPEIFAAHGIVALSPPMIPSPDTMVDIRSFRLAYALADLHGMAEHVNISKMSLKNNMNGYFKAIEKKINNALVTLNNYEQHAKDFLKRPEDRSWMKDLLDDLGEFAGQGVYLLDQNGLIKCYEIADELRPTREAELAKRRRKGFSDRPYFRQARTFSEKFISDVYPSVFNELATFSVCFPIKSDEHIFAGLLFSACQVGQWKEPVDLAKDMQGKKRSVLLLDSNGICLLPPNNEFAYETSRYKKEERIGFVYDDLLVLSRRDKLVSRVMENLIPLGQDDDVFSISSDLMYYSIIKEIPYSRWKLAISSRVVLSK